MKMPVEVCKECGCEEWNLGEFILSAKTEYVYCVQCCAKCGNALFFMMGKA